MLYINHFYDTCIDLPSWNREFIKPSELTKLCLENSLEDVLRILQNERHHYIQYETISTVHTAD